MTYHGRHRRIGARARSASARALVTVLCLAGVAGGCVALAAPALASSRPVVTGLSRHQGPYWGATQVTVRGNYFVDVSKVLFGKRAGYLVQVVSPHKLIVIDPQHKYGSVHVRVVTASGTSARNAVDGFTFVRPTMDTPIMGGLTARQEQRISARVRAAHKGVYIAPWRKHWTPAMGTTALHRARSWLGLPYSWAGGSGAGPTYGVCAHNGGDLDCHVVGFDCSGLSLYAWSPYRQLDHYAATQHVQAGRFHPTMGQLMPGDLVFFSGYIADGIGHVAVYAGHGMVIQAAQSGTLVMRSRLADVIAESGVYRGATRPMSTGRQGPLPRVSSMTTQLPVSGGYLRITGRRLAHATAVNVGGRLIYSFVRRTPRRLVVKAPAHAAGRVTVTVSNAWGSAKRQLGYVAAPQISSLSPSGGPTSGNTRVTITGRHLNTVRQVTFGGKSVPFKLATNTITTTAPPHAAATVQVVVSSPFGTSNAEPYTYGGSSSAASRSPSAARPRAVLKPHTSAPRPPENAKVGSTFYEDRIGDEWYLVGRRARAQLLRN